MENRPDILPRPPIFPEPKTGLKTSELWVTVLATALNLAVVYGVATVDETTAWLAFGTALIGIVPAIVYTWSRTKVKTNGLG